MDPLFSNIKKPIIINSLLKSFSFIRLSHWIYISLLYSFQGYTFNSNNLIQKVQKIWNWSNRILNFANYRGWRTPSNFITFSFEPKLSLFGEITKMITRVNSWFCTNSPYICFQNFRENRHYQNGQFQDNHENHI